MHEPVAVFLQLWFITVWAHLRGSNPLLYSVSTLLSVNVEKEQNYFFYKEKINFSRFIWSNKNKNTYSFSFAYLTCGCGQTWWFSQHQANSLSMRFALVVRLSHDGRCEEHVTERTAFISVHLILCTVLKRKKYRSYRICILSIQGGKSLMQQMHLWKNIRNVCYIERWLLMFWGMNNESIKNFSLQSKR